MKKEATVPLIPGTKDIGGLMSIYKTMKESTGFRLSPEEIKKKIARLEATLAKEPENADDLKAEIAELQGALKKKSSCC